MAMSDYLSFLISKEFTEEEKMSMKLSNEYKIEDAWVDACIINFTNKIMEILEGKGQ